MDIEFQDFEATFQGKKGFYFLFLDGFHFDKETRCISYQEDSTESLSEQTFEDFRKFHKKCKQACFEQDTEDSSVHTKILFFLQKLSSLEHFGFPNSTERRWTQHWLLANQNS